MDILMEICEDSINLRSLTLRSIERLFFTFSITFLRLYLVSKCDGFLPMKFVFVLIKLLTACTPILINIPLHSVCKQPNLHICKYHRLMLQHVAYDE